MTRALEMIACVEDEADIREVLRIALVTLGKFDVTMYAAGAHALEGIADFPPDLILLDVMMPGMDGPTVLAKLQENSETAAIPVVFLTAKARPPELRVYLEAGAVDVIVKPFDPLTLADRIRGIWDRIYE